MNDVRSRRRSMVVGTTAVLALGLLLALPAFACTPSANIAVEPASAEAGSTGQVSGNLFDPEGGTIKLWWDGGSGELLASIEAPADGTFTQQITIPSAAEPGSHSITATQKASDGNWYTAPAAFEVTEPAASDDGGTQEPAPAEDEPAAEEQPAEEPAAEEQPAEEPAAEEQPAEEPAAEEQPAEEPAAEEQPAQQQADEPVAEERPAGVSQPAEDGELQQTVPAPPPGGADDATVDQQAEVAAKVPSGIARAEAFTEEAPLAGAVSHQAAPAGDRDDREPAGAAVEARQLEVEGPSPWFLIPLALVATGLFVAGAGTVVHEVRERRSRARA